MKICPYCGKVVGTDVIQCPFCFANIDDNPHIDVDEEAKKATKKKGDK